MTVPLVGAVHDWYCPRCGATDQTMEPRPHSRFHPCPKLGYLTFPMLPAGTKAKVERREREDYVGNDIPQTDDDGRPVMSVVTTRDEGQDVVIFAPTATGRGS